MQPLPLRCQPARLLLGQNDARGGTARRQESNRALWERSTGPERGVASAKRPGQMAARSAHLQLLEVEDDASAPAVDANLAPACSVAKEGAEVLLLSADARF